MARHPQARGRYRSQIRKIMKKTTKLRRISKLNAVPHKAVLAASDEGIYTNSNFECHPKVGRIVWGKFGKTKWFPAVVVSANDCGKSDARNECNWVFWFGDNKISQVPNANIKPFRENFKPFYMDMKLKAGDRALHEALACLSQVIQAEVQNNFADLLNWAKCGFPTQSPYLIEDTVIPEIVQKQLAKIKELELHSSSPSSIEASPLPSKQGTSKGGDLVTRKQSSLKGQVSEKVKQGNLKLEDICIGCESDSHSIIAQHPLFYGGLCSHCKDKLMEALFAIGSDGVPVQCQICSEYGDLLVCDNSECKKCYCVGCITTYVSSDAPKQVKETDHWGCYLCSKQVNGLLKSKPNWRENTAKFYNSYNTPDSLSICCVAERKGIRVLSLFDGIATGKYVLNLLNIEVHAYFASEIDHDAIQVGKYNHKGTITYLGDVKKIDERTIADISPIDLVLGGSPCNDISVVNRSRKGLLDNTGTGPLFFEFFRILSIIKRHNNQKRNTFFMSENVNSMSPDCKQTMSQFLQCNPVLVNSIDYSCQSRPRLFWTNIPGMSRFQQAIDEKDRPCLQQCLLRELGRMAMVKQVRTFTTQSNSFVQKDNEMPVFQDGQCCSLHIIEKEKIFGFTTHYTDVGDIQLSKRHKLLGKAWCSIVVKMILSPLKFFFKSSE